jgi:hypothetical protein
MAGACFRSSEGTGVVGSTALASCTSAFVLHPNLPTGNAFEQEEQEGVGCRVSLLQCAVRQSHAEWPRISVFEDKESCSTT